MKKLILSAQFILLISANAMVGTNQAVEAYLEQEFRSIKNISEFSYLGQSESCDETLDVYVVGAKGQRETAYSCSICLINDGGVATVDSLESNCFRE